MVNEFKCFGVMSWVIWFYKRTCHLTISFLIKLVNIINPSSFIPLSLQHDNVVVLFMAQNVWNPIVSLTPKIFPQCSGPVTPMSPPLPCYSWHLDNPTAWTNQVPEPWSRDQTRPIRGRVSAASSWWHSFITIIPAPATQGNILLKCGDKIVNLIRKQLKIWEIWQILFCFLLNTSIILSIIISLYS